MLGCKYDAAQVIESVHNYIDFDRFILHKGAISAAAGELCVVALNMSEGVLLCKGRGAEDWNYSCAHEAGRALSRTEAGRLKMSKFKDAMSGVYSSSVIKACLDEAPEAYKDSKMIIGAIQETVEIIDQMKPVLNIKAVT